MTSFWKRDDHLPAFLYAKGIIEHHAKSFSFATQFLPKEKRWATYAVYAFCRYADNIVDKPRKRDDRIILDELSTLKYELELAFRFGESEHPVIKSFVIVAKEFNIPSKYAFELIEGVEMDMSIDRYDNFDDLYVFCYKVAAVVGLMMTYVLGFSDKTALVYAEKLGIAMQLTNILRDIKEDKNMGRIYIPLDDREKFGISEEDIFTENLSDKMRELVKFQVIRARQYYDESKAGVAMLDSGSQFAIYAASRIYSGILNKIETVGYSPFTDRVFVSKSEKIAILSEELVKRKLGIRR